MLRRFNIRMLLVPSFGLISVLVAPAAPLSSVTSGHSRLLAAHAGGAPVMGNASSRIWKEGQWFQLSHLGNRRPAPDSRRPARAAESRGRSR